MDDPRTAPRIRHGLIPLLVAMRVAEERKARATGTAQTATEAADSPSRKRGWRRWFS